MKPYLLLDVDGPINPYRLITKKGYTPPKTPKGEDPYEYTKHWLRPPGWVGGDLPVLISEEMGADLIDLQEQFDIIWATTWEKAAQTMIAPNLGLSTDLPFIPWDLNHPSLRSGRATTLFWKAPLVLDWLDEQEPRPWVFLDDELFRPDRAATRVRLGKEGESDTPWKMVQIQPSQGIRRNDVTALRAWASALP